MNRHLGESNRHTDSDHDVDEMTRNPAIGRLAAGGSEPRHYGAVDGAALHKAAGHLGNVLAGDSAAGHVVPSVPVVTRRARRFPDDREKSTGRGGPRDPCDHRRRGSIHRALARTNQVRSYGSPRCKPHPAGIRERLNRACPPMMRIAGRTMISPT